MKKTLALVLMVIGSFGCDLVDKDVQLDCEFPQTDFDVTKSNFSTEGMHVNLSDGYVIRVGKIYAESMAGLMVEKKAYVKKKLSSGDIIRISNIDIGDRIISFEIDNQNIVFTKNDSLEVYDWVMQDSKMWCQRYRANI